MLYGACCWVLQVQSSCVSYANINRRDGVNKQLHNYKQLLNAAVAGARLPVSASLATTAAIYKHY